MKKYLPLLVFFHLAGTEIKSQTSACDIRNIAIQLRNITNVNGTCSAVFDLSYEQKTNNGNEMVFIHLWNAADYPDLLGNGLAYTHPSDHPSVTDLEDAIANILIEETTTPTPQLGNSYLHDPTLPILLDPNMEIFKINVDAEWDRITITDIPLTLSNCNGASIIADIWGCQAANNHIVHCYATNRPFVVGNPMVTGSLNCTTPRKYNLGIQNLGLADITSVYKVYVDNGDHLYEPGGETLAYTSDEKIISAGNSFSVSNQAYPPYDGLQPYSEQGLWIEVTTTGFPNRAIYFLNNSCFALQVSYSSFSADRKNDKVDLCWTTATETNNTGFEIRRQIGNEEVKTIATIGSQAPLGTSTYKIDYTFSDHNPTTSVTVYRLRQVDIDGRYSYSDYRMVPGKGMGLLVYPNPVNTDQFYILMSYDQRGHDVAMFDVYGRLMQQWSNVTSHELVVKKPPPGLYTIRVTNRITQEIKTTKIVVMNP